ncbi:type II secretion system minor pseudopilin GspK [Nitrosospira sp. Nsp13]|uniref:type II secretion system minor pseudopilin GspK n=1 Tax=Nitrosospira sp. Nsp13 TaxID=1855332 RepID=UPI000886F3B9|nr:type II secretion system minor pseudopilin GspK [Nitrosospira sp. Nsp13]SCY41645.1 general secretion pathway protein K [Nitrosospira sp. Nsp13]
MRAAQRGVAVVLAMSVVALATMAATAIIIPQSIWMRQNQLTNEHVQAQVMVQAGVDWVRAVLSDDRRLSNVDHLGEAWALRMPVMPIEKGELAGHIDDQQGMFNLNNLVQDGKISATHLVRFKRLLAFLSLPAALADALVDWMDADSAPQPQGGTEDEYYLGLNPPYLASNRPLTDVTELALVRGFDSAVRARLRPFVTALPRFTPINVNTAPPEVLAAVIEGLGINGARTLVEQRQRAYFRDDADFLNRLPEGAVAEDSDVSISSDYFMATLRVTRGEAQAQGMVLLARVDAGWPIIIWRKYL